MVTDALNFIQKCLPEDRPLVLSAIDYELLHFTMLKSIQIVFIVAT